MTGWHMHTGITRLLPGQDGDCYWCDAIASLAFLPGERKPTTPVLVLPLDGLREQIARTIWNGQHSGFPWSLANDEAQEGCHRAADAVLALLAGVAAGQGTT